MSIPRSDRSKQTRRLSARAKRGGVYRSIRGDESGLRTSFNEGRSGGTGEKVGTNLIRAAIAALDQSSGVSLRSRFLVECRFFESSRASFAALVGFVALRFLGMMSARLTRSASRCSARSRLRPWLRMSLATTRMLPSVVSRDASFSRRRARCSSVSARDPGTFQKISTRDDVLFTCCPPAPDDRDTRTSSSLRGIESDSLTARRFRGAVAEVSLTTSTPAEQLERGEERDYSPNENDEHLGSDRGKRCSL